MFTQESLRKIRRDLEEDLKALEERHKIKIDIGKMNYTSCQFTCKMTVTEVSDDTERNLFEQSCYSYGLKPSDYKAIIHLKQGGKDVAFEVYGFDNAKRKAPIRIRRVDDGGLFLVPMDSISHIAWKGSTLIKTDMDGNPIK